MNRDPGKAVLMLDLVMEFFDAGRHWTKGQYHDGRGNRCMLGAMQHIRKVHNLTGDPTRYYLLEAQPQHRITPVNWYNDSCPCFGAVFEWVLAARKLALADLEKEQPQKLAA